MFNITLTPIIWLNSLNSYININDTLIYFRPIFIPNITTDVEVKRYITKFILFMTCGDRTVLGHVDTMMISNYIRYIPEFDGSIPQDNAHYKIS